jgi:ABC-type multidrug transport system fused ATPase/permease subunit
MVALFRIEKLRKGEIIIDDVDISQVPVQVLRSKLGIIPQEAVIFSASVRYNLGIILIISISTCYNYTNIILNIFHIDPFQNHTDECLWDVLDAVNMKKAIQVC